MWIKRNVVMLPTNEKVSKIWKNNSTGTLAYVENEKPNIAMRNTWTPQHLYILSDEEIKEGDWYLANEANRKDDTPIYVVKKCDNIINGWLKSNTTPGQGDNPDWSKKIIATTDKSIKLELDGYRGNLLPDVSFDIEIPQPSQSFIEKYIEEYNKGNVIIEAIVEYECISNYNDIEILNKDFKYKLKINSDNTINLKN